MNTPLQITLAIGDWSDLFLHFLGLSLLSIGGAITTVAEMHRYLVVEHHWLSDAQFNASIALAQSAPGPNLLFVALLGWNVGLNAGGLGTALLGVLASMAGILIPSTTLTYLAAHWGHRNRGLRAVRAFKQGMAPIVVALIVATGWILTGVNGTAEPELARWGLILVTVFLVWRTKIHLLWLLAAGALLGWLGVV
ncbi:MAG TPA: chromate transporter [Burkholderiaceae bacterium]|nr:chromate transporter [Burkholderiaceae bacterium]